MRLEAAELTEVLGIIVVVGEIFLEGIDAPGNLGFGEPEVEFVKSSG